MTDDTLREALWRISQQAHISGGQWAMETARAALNQSPEPTAAPPVVSGDMVMVPREPNEAMIRALDKGLHAKWPNARAMAVAAWEAMLAAAPKASPVEGEVTRLPTLLRGHVVDTLLCESEQHVIADCVAIVRRAADQLEATLSTEAVPVERDILDAADYLIDRLWAVYRGEVVRDLDEAALRYENSRKALNPSLGGGGR